MNRGGGSGAFTRCTEHMMTPLAMLLLLSTGLIGSAFMAGPDDADPADPPAEDDEASAHDFSNGDLVSDSLTSADASGHAPSSDAAGPAPAGAGSHGDESATQGTDAPDKGRDIRGSGGNDILEVSAAQGESGHSFRGGDGRDFIRTSAVSDDEGYTARDLFDSHLGGGGNTVYGGRGDDVMEISRDDVAEGGEGQDVFVVMANPADGGSHGPAVVRDLHADQDTIVIDLPRALQGDGADTPLHARVAQRVDGEDTVILVNGTPAVRILGQTAIAVGTQDDPDAPFSISNLAAITDAGHLQLTGLDGHAVSGRLPDVILRYYTETA